MASPQASRDMAHAISYRALMNVLGSSSGVVRPRSPVRRRRHLLSRTTTKRLVRRVGNEIHPEVALGCILTPVPIIARAREPRHSSSRLAFSIVTHLFYPATYGITRTPEIFTGEQKSHDRAADAQHAMSAKPAIGIPA